MRSLHEASAQLLVKEQTLRSEEKRRHKDAEAAWRLSANDEHVLIDNDKVRERITLVAKSSDQTFNSSAVPLYSVLFMVAVLHSPQVWQAKLKRQAESYAEALSELQENLAQERKGAEAAAKAHDLELASVRTEANAIVLQLKAALAEQEAVLVRIAHR